jgi:sulfotransferase family protein
MKWSEDSLSNELYAEYERKLVWIFGTPRSGSTWLAREILARERIAVVREPLIGAFIGVFQEDIMLYYLVTQGREVIEFQRIIDASMGDDRRFFCATFEPVWLKSIGRMILDRFTAQFNIKEYDYVIVKAPNESHAADIIMKCFPTSRLIFLMRDGRDVIDSRQGKFYNPETKIRPNTPEEMRYRITYYANLWNMHMTITNRAYELHNPTLRCLVKYEDLRLDPFAQVKKIYEFLGIALSDKEIIEVIERTKFENVSEDERGEDKIKRKASPGSWKETFSADEVQLMNRIMSPILLKFGYKF